MGSPIFITGIATIVSVLFTFFVTTLAYQKAFKSMITEAIKNHKDSLHQDSIYDHVEKELVKHEERCRATSELVAVNSKVDKVEKAVIWLVEKQGGNLRDLGLI